MSTATRRTVHKVRMVLAGFALIALAACASPFSANVSRFQSQLPPPQGQSFAIVADDAKLAGGIEFGQYAQLVSARMAKLGYTPAASPAQAQLIVRFDYGVDTGRTRVTSTGLGAGGWGPWSGYGGYGGFGGFGGGFGRGGFGGRGGFYGGGLWNYGWYDPFFDGGVSSYTVYTSGIDMKIERQGDGQRLFEGKAEAVSTSNRLQYLVPNLIDAMFTNFPGNSGETMRITVAPEKNGSRETAVR